ncbi:fibroblast growth factor 17 isoform X1 [Zootermopsis nevadensis]|uniref:fibroblast growth factor 17 isoform X1 n=3 Tax=Zootermopsis nevadensis TaxID=136037 RepID=UPI000B8ECF44|nr:fibroblast growth factor 17 isoform X1 [Zootermopsis nevadensis]
MLLTVYTLPQLAVSAKLLCLLMVVICGAVPSMVRSVRLYNDCSSSDVRVDLKGRVLADDDKSDKYQNLTIKSLDFSVKLTIFAEESRMYLCFNRKWKLVGSKRFRGAMCEFYEDMTNGYNRYRSAANESRFVGFNRRGKPLKSGLARHKEKCLNFLKFDTEFSINHHNQKLAGGNHSAQVPVHAHQQLLSSKRNKHSRKNSPPRLRHRNSKNIS